MMTLQTMPNVAQPFKQLPQLPLQPKSALHRQPSDLVIIKETYLDFVCCSLGGAATATSNKYQAIM